VSNIELSIPIELTIRRIIVAGQDIDKDAARALALELHDILAKIQQYYADRPRIIADGRPEYEAGDLVLTVWETALNHWPEDRDAAASTSMWIAETLGDVGDLYNRYLRVADQIASTDLAADLNEDRAPRGRPQ
jgi:hypothetical protein